MCILGNSVCLIGIDGGTVLVFVCDGAGKILEVSTGVLILTSGCTWQELITSPSLLHFELNFKSCSLIFFTESLT